jgi:hypothetical protein
LHEQQNKKREPRAIPQKIARGQEQVVFAISFHRFVALTRFVPEILTKKIVLLDKLLVAPERC